jgi:hypothetical protein
MHAIYAYRPFPGHKHPAGIDARAPGMLDAWLRHFPDSRPYPLPTRDTEGSDPEDWIENATIMHAAEALGVDLTILPNGGGVHVSSSGWLPPIARPGAPIGSMLGYWSTDDFLRGLPIDMDPVGSDRRAVLATGNYATSETFRRHAGRPVVLSRGQVDGANGLEASLRRIVDETGSHTVFMKTVQKSWSGVFDLDPSTPTGMWNALMTADMRLMDETDCEEGYDLSFIPVTHETSSADILIMQGVIRPTYEYRIVVIDGRPVTASGCIEAYTPAENEAVFDPQMEKIRSDGEVVSRADLVQRYLDFAETFCAEFAAERGQGLDYGLDVCIDANTGSVVPIELNPCLNLGAYARSTEAWLSAIVERAERLALASKEKTA